jgi:hypothetical protein
VEMFPEIVTEIVNSTINPEKAIVNGISRHWM